MDAYLELEPARRRVLCDEAGGKLGLAAESVEKDYWMCWTLRELFALTDCGADLTFKGGTSLSKGWGLIQRFSEDVDVVIARERLGFGGDRAPDRAGISGNERERRLDALRDACKAFVRVDLASKLEAQFGRSLSKRERWTLAVDPDDPDGQTILFTYPSEFLAARYVRPIVKIELGARSDTEPNENPTIRPYVAEAFSDLLPDSAFRVRTVAPVRTFWEKAMLLHEEGHRAGGVPPRARLARHYYDLWCLIVAGVGARAAVDLALFERIAAHRGVFFKKSRAAQATLRPGSLRILPREEHREAWARDYAAMREAMFFDEPPDFDVLLRRIGEFESEFNARGADLR